MLHRQLMPKMATRMLTIASEIHNDPSSRANPATRNTGQQRLVK